MIYRTRGVVFRTIKFSETSVVTKIYTEKFGMQSYIVNSVRSSKSKTKASLLQVMTLLEMEVYHREHHHLNRIKEMRSFHLYTSMFFDPLKSSVGLFMMEVLNKCIREEEHNEAMFEFIVSQLQTLDQNRMMPDFLLKFLLSLSALLGFYPNGEYSPGTQGFDLTEGKFVNDLPLHPYLLQHPLSENFSELLHDSSKNMDSNIRRSLLEALLQYYQLHVPNFSRPKSLHVLDELFRH